MRFFTSKLCAIAFAISAASLWSAPLGHSEGQTTEEAKAPESEDPIVDLSMTSDGAFSLLFVKASMLAGFHAELASARELGEDRYLSRTFGPVLSEFQAINETATVFGYAPPTDEYVQAGASMCAANLVALTETEAADASDERLLKNVQLFILHALQRADDRSEMLRLIPQLKSAGDYETAMKFETTSKRLMDRAQVYAVHMLLIENVRAIIESEGPDAEIVQNATTIIEFCNAEAERLMMKAELASAD